MTRLRTCWAAMVLGVVVITTGGGLADSPTPSQFALGTPGVVGGISVTPQPVPVGEQAMITVSGFGQCGSVIVDFGDRSTVTLTNVTFPRTVSHTYVQARRYTVSATAGTNCNALSRVQTSFDVERSLDLLCALTGCDDIERPAPCPNPVIKSVFYTTPLEPTEVVSLFGCGFGDTSQKVNLKGVFNVPGQFGVNPNAAVPLTIVFWSPTHIIAKVPTLISAKDQTAALQIVFGEAPKARFSNSMPVAFQATREFRVLSEDDGLDVIRTICQKTPMVNSICEVNFRIAGVHHVQIPDWSNEAALAGFSDDWGPDRSGIDYIVINLANGWVLETYDTNIEAFYGVDFLYGPSWTSGSYPNMSYYWLSNQWPFKVNPIDASNFIPGASSGALKFVWTLSAGEKTHFRALIVVKGPIGVSLK